MQFPASLSDKAIGHVSELRQMRRGQLKWVFDKLDAPRLEELSGEFDAELLSQGNWLQNVFIRSLFNGTGRWAGKAMSPSTSHEGRGYNIFVYRSGISQRYPMRTYVATGRSGRGRSLFLDYRPFGDWLARQMIDEVRQVTPGVYLGFGVVGPGFFWRRKIYFLLAGPRRAFSPDAAMALRLRQQTAAPSLRPSLACS